MHEGKDTLDQIHIERFFGKEQVVELYQEWPRKVGLFFIEQIEIEELNRIVDLNLGFVGGNITEDLERALLGREIIIYIRLVNLELIPKRKIFMFYGLPLKIGSGNGSSVRAIAIIDN